MLSLLLSLAPFLIAHAPLAPVPQATQPLDSYTITSPDRSYELFVATEDREGELGAEYVLSSGGRERWRVRHDFTLWDAFVTDDGRVGGYSNADFEGLPDREDGEFLGVIVFDDFGAVLHSEWTKRQNQRKLASDLIRTFPSGAQTKDETPYVKDMLLLFDAELFVLRIFDARLPGELWSAFSMQTGERVDWGITSSEKGASGWLRYAMLPDTSIATSDDQPTAEGDELKPGEDRYETLAEAYVVPGTDMILERWVVGAASDAPRSNIINLINDEGACVYRKVERHKFLSEETYADAEFDPALQARFVVDKALPRFAEREVSEYAEPLYLAEYEVMIQRPGWFSSELSQVSIVRRPGTGAPEVPDTPASEVKLELIDSVRAPIEVPGAEFRDGHWWAKGFFDDSLAWQVLANGELLVVRHDQTGAVRCVRYDADFQELETVPIDGPHGFAVFDDEFNSFAQLFGLSAHNELWFAVGEGRWVVTQGDAVFHVDGRAGEVRAIDLETLFKQACLESDASAKDTSGTLEELLAASGAAFAAAIECESALALPDGGILLALHLPSNHRALLALDARFQVDWFDYRTPPNGVGAPFYQVTTTKDGRIVAERSYPNTVLVWQPDGQFVGELTLPEGMPSIGSMWSWAPNEILFSLPYEEEGLQAFNLDTGAVRSLANGEQTFISQLLMMPRSFSLPLGDEMVSMPSGETWVRGRNALSRLDTEGRFVETRIRQTEGMQWPGSATVLHDGRVLVFDPLQAQMWVWNPESPELDVLNLAGPDGVVGAYGLDLLIPQITERADGRIQGSLPFPFSLIFRGSRWPGSSPVFTWMPGEEHMQWGWNPNHVLQTLDGRYQWQWTMSPGDEVTVRTAEGEEVRTIARHGRGLWWGLMAWTTFADDGSIWVWELNDPDNVAHPPHRIHYSPDGVELGVYTWDLSCAPFASGIRFDGRLALAMFDGKTRIVERPLSRAPRVHWVPDLPIGPAVLPDHAPDELWVFELETLTLHRYKLPAELLGE